MLRWCYGKTKQHRSIETEDKTVAAEAHACATLSDLVVDVAVAGVAPGGEVGEAKHEAMLRLQPVHQHVLVDEAAAVNL